MPRYSRGLLGRTPVEAVDTIGVALLDDARQARRRLKDAADEDALHDFRVALRRLRSVLRAFRPYVEHQVPNKLRRRLRDLTRATNTARDAEVQVLWVKGRRSDLTPTQRVGANWFLERLEETQQREYNASVRAVRQDFARLDRSLRQRLAAAAEQPLGGDGTRLTFAGALRALVEDHAATLRERGREIRSARDEAAVHSARISAKRLRYLLELVVDRVPPAKTAVRQLKDLQTVLGELHDAQVVEEEFVVTSERAAAEHARRLSKLQKEEGLDTRERRRILRRNATPGMLALTKLCREAQEETFARFCAWRQDQTMLLDRDITLVLQALVTPERPDEGVEVERKYLLTRLPKVIETADKVDVDQGWLPGTRLLERVRRTRGKNGVHYFRTVKLGEGLVRTEVEEAASQEVFERLWPLTEGRRVTKRRYYVPDGAFTWELDEFLDRELFLAEIELASPEVDVVVPEWLAPVVDREVTGEPEFLNVNLAR